MPDEGIDYDDVLDHWLWRQFWAIMSQPTCFGTMIEIAFWRARFREMEQYGTCRTVQLFAYPESVKARR